MAFRIKKIEQVAGLVGKVFNNMALDSDIDAPSINAVKNAFSNPNFLINSDFRKCGQTTVNQRGKSGYNYTGTKIYTIDRWALSGSSDGLGSLAVNSYSIKFTKTGGTYVTLVQQFETPLSSEKGFTVSCEVSSGISLVIGTNPITVYNLVAGVNVVNISPNVSFDMIYFYMETNTSVDIKWIKLEEGNIATPLTAQLYNKELAMCRRYYVKYTKQALHSAVSVNNQIYLLIENSFRTKPTLKLDAINAYIPLTDAYPIIRDGVDVYTHSAENGTLLTISNASFASGYVIFPYSCYFELDAEIY